jgi:hypothetical protein
MATLNPLKQPEIGFYALPMTLNRIADVNTNVPLRSTRSYRGTGFANLLAYGLTQEALAVMTELITVTDLAENYLQGSLSNPDLYALTCQRDQAYHRLLSLPTYEALVATFGTSGINRCCRLAAIVFTTGLLFPVPRSTGVPQTLVTEIKKCLEQISFDFLGSEGVRLFFIWVMVIGGISAERLPERPWFEKSLTDLLASGGVREWVEVEKIVESFLWMVPGCESGAMELWDSIAAALRNEVDCGALGVVVDVD